MPDGSHGGGRVPTTLILLPFAVVVCGLKVGVYFSLWQIATIGIPLTFSYPLMLTSNSPLKKPSLEIGRVSYSVIFLLVIHVKEDFKKMDKQKGNLDEVLDKFSIFEPYHLRLMCCAWFAYATNSMHCYNYIFAAEETGYICKDEAFGNNTCSSVNGTKCSEWVYDNPHSFVAEFNLACQDWKRTLVGTVHSFGYMMGLLIVGPVSDRIGRKTAVVATGVLGSLLGLAKSFSYNYWLYIFLEFVEPAVGDCCSPLFLLLLEMVSARKRVTYDNFCELGLAIGGVLLALAAWGVPYWRNFVRTIYAPSFLLGLLIFLVDESPRWALSNGKKDKAVAIVQKMRKTNKVELDKDALDKLLIEKDARGVSFGRLLEMTFTSKILLKRCLICIVWWITSTFVNHGLMINSVSLQGNKYVNYALVAFIDVPAAFLVMVTLNYFKRRNPLIISFLIGAVLCLIQPFLPRGYPWLSLLTYLIGFMMTTSFFTITYIYTSELFPTYTRNSMHALCSSVGRIGSMLAPQTPLLMAYWEGLPSLLFGSACLIAGLVTFLVPDTANVSLPDTVKESEDIGKQKKEIIGIDNLGLVNESV